VFIEVDGREIDCKVAVFNRRLLGMDVLRYMDLHLDIPNGIVTISGDHEKDLATLEEFCGLVEGFDNFSDRSIEAEVEDSMLANVIEQNATEPISQLV
jgi:hypothetical protein